MNGISYSLIAPADSIFTFPNPQTIPSRIEVHGFNNRTTAPPIYRNVSLGFSDAGISAGSVQTLTMFYTSDISDSTNLNTPINVNITEYGSVGQFIAGDFTGTLTGAGPAFTLYNITCNFRVRRTQ